MNTTAITINGSEVLLKFGIWTLARLVDRGYKMKDLAEMLNNNPFDFIPVLIYLGACNAKGMSLDAYDEVIFWDYVDEVGLGSKEVTKVINCFTNSLSRDVPNEEKKSIAKVKNQ